MYNVSNPTYSSEDELFNNLVEDLKRKNDNAASDDITSSKLKKSMNNQDIEETDSNNLNRQNLIVNNNKESSNIIINPTLMKLSFDNNSDFSKIPWTNLKPILINTSNSWEFISFTYDHKSIIFKENNIENVKKLTELTSFTDNGKEINIKVCTIQENIVKGIIYDKFLVPIDEDTLKVILKNQGVKDIVKIYKTNQEGEKLPTGSVILIFDQNEFRDNVIIELIQLKVNKLIAKPMQCSHCGYIGHTIKKCKWIKVIFCKICFSKHNNDVDCNVECINCNGSHFSNDKKCPAFIKEKEIVRFKDENQITYFNAKNIIEKNGFVNNNKNIKSRTEILRENEISDLKEKFDQLSANYDIINTENINYKTLIVPELQSENIELRATIEKINASHHDEMTSIYTKTNDLVEKSQNKLKESEDRLKNAYDKFSELEQNFKETINKQSKDLKNFIDSSGVVRKAYETYMRKINESTSSSLNHISFE